MEDILTVTENCKPPIVEADELRGVLLKILRLGSLRARLIATHFDTLGVSLKANWMPSAAVLEALDEISVCELPIWDFIPEIEVRR
jgi:hypothetical protein